MTRAELIVRLPVLRQLAEVVGRRWIDYYKGFVIYDRDDAEYIRTFDPPTVITLIDALSEAERKLGEARELLDMGLYYLFPASWDLTGWLARRDAFLSKSSTELGDLCDADHNRTPAPEGDRKEPSVPRSGTEVAELAMRLRDGAADGRDELQQRVKSAQDGWQPIETALKDGTLILLLVPASDECEGLLEDSTVGRTIGSWAVKTTGEEGWNFAGWDWCHDAYVEGGGEPTHWQPLPPPPLGDTP